MVELVVVIGFVDILYVGERVWVVLDVLVVVVIPFVTVWVGLHWVVVVACVGVGVLVAIVEHI